MVLMMLPSESLTTMTLGWLGSQSSQLHLIYAIITLPSCGHPNFAYGMILTHRRDIRLAKEAVILPSFLAKHYIASNRGRRGATEGVLEAVKQHSTTLPLPNATQFKKSQELLALRRWRGGAHLLQKVWC